MAASVRYRTSSLVSRLSLGEEGDRHDLFLVFIVIKECSIVVYNRVFNDVYLTACNSSSILFTPYKNIKQILKKNNIND